MYKLGSLRYDRDMNSKQELAADIVTTYIQGPKLAEAMDLLDSLVRLDAQNMRLSGSEGLRPSELAHKVVDMMWEDEEG